MMHIVASLVKREASYRLEVGQQHGMVQELYHTCLFALKTGPGLNAPPKCKTRASRVMAFTFLVELCRGCGENFEELLALLAPHHTSNNTPKFVTWEYHPSSDDKPPIGYVGLKNLGNTCYMNALLQQFYMIPHIRYGLLSIQPNDNKPKEDNLVVQMQHIFGYLQESEKVAYEPTQFCLAYKDWDGKPTNVHLQQDVDEFFNLLCQRLEAQMKNGPGEKLLSSIFGGKISNEIRSGTKI
jgi:ubiquitin carboxyl-terminal hydrolase 34